MITVRPSNERGAVDFGWLQSQHSFSFGHYYDEKHMGFRDLRVINEDHVAPGAGFPEHGHRDMEIITVVLNGTLEHKDSLGTGSAIRAGDVQRMTAGKGILHSEFNGSQTDPVHLLQIWILPEGTGLKPDYEEKHFPNLTQPGLHLLAAKGGTDGAVHVNQDLRLYRAQVNSAQPLEVPLAKGRHAWVQTISGTLDLNGTKLHAGDGAAVSNEALLTLKGTGDALVFDLN